MLNAQFPATACTTDAPGAHIGRIDNAGESDPVPLHSGAEDRSLGQGHDSNSPLVDATHGLVVLGIAELGQPAAHRRHR